MKTTLLISLLLAAQAGWAGPHMRVTVCNLRHVPETVVAQAQDDVARTFGSLGVEIVWTACGAAVDLDSAYAGAEFVVRLRLDSEPAGSSPAVESMGAAFVTPDRLGGLADAYYGVIQAAAVSSCACDPGEMLGRVMAHEIGHLLLGPGHASRGIMSAAWASQGAVGFDAAERAAILAELRAQTARAAAGRLSVSAARR